MAAIAGESSWWCIPPSSRLLPAGEFQTHVCNHSQLGSIRKKLPEEIFPSFAREFNRKHVKQWLVATTGGFHRFKVLCSACNNVQCNKPSWKTPSQSLHIGCLGLKLGKICKTLEFDNVGSATKQLSILRVFVSNDGKQCFCISLHRKQRKWKEPKIRSGVLLGSEPWSWSW